MIKKGNISGKFPGEPANSYSWKRGLSLRLSEQVTVSVYFSYFEALRKRKSAMV